MHTTGIKILLSMTENIENITSPDIKLSFLQKVKKKLFHWFRLSNEKMIKVYHGYGNDKHLMIMGHVFSVSPMPRKKYKRNVWTNSLALIRYFMVRSVPNVKVHTTWEGKKWEVQAATDGFFRFEISLDKPLQPGLHTITIMLAGSQLKSRYKWIAKSKGTFIIPNPNQYGFISDIDDTFLISHSSSFFKKLYVLFTKNAHSRKPFAGVVRHYNLLARSNAQTDKPNPFFYVSSSEWNLYNFINDFISKNGLPPGVLLLSQVKKLHELFKTGSGKHAAKFMRIARILESFPNQQFVLFGDDSQQDPSIYASIVEHFPHRITCVYLRHVYKKNLVNVEALIKSIVAKGVPCCHFESSKEAIAHSISIGLIDAGKVVVK
jgi:phosphatidate phosphatase APP1